MTSHPISSSMPDIDGIENGTGITSWLIRIPLLLVIGSLLLVLVLALLLFAFQSQYTDRIYPGVSALGVDLSGMTQAEAAQALADDFEYGNQAVFTFRDGENFWQLSAAELGVSFDAEETAARAFAVGHDNNPIQSLSTQADAWFSGQRVSPIITYDQNVAVAQLQLIAEEINIEAVDAILRVDNGAIHITESRAGRTVDIAATITQLDGIITQMNSGAEIDLVITETPPVAANIDEVTNRIQTALSGPLHLVATDEAGAQLGPWTVTTDQIAQLLNISLINNPDGTPHYEVDIDMGAFEGFLTELAPGLITPARDGRFDFDPLTGDLQVIQPSVSGRTLNVAETLDRLEDGVFATDNRIVPMAFDYTLPRYHNQITAAELGIRELVAESTTYFEGSTQNRRTNIAVGTGRLNGIIVGPGEEFSFNYHLGDINYDNGFVDGQVIFGGRTVTGIGGGICQVSTTVFRAAFTGGFAITERNSHGYRVGFYELRDGPPGLDAAIWQPQRDFKFQNNTPYHLLIESSFNPTTNELQFRFYSTKHWQAELEEPIVKNLEPAPEPRFEANRDLNPGDVVQVDYAAEGADVTIFRKVYDMEGNLVIEDSSFTHYVPWQAIYQVAPGDSRLSQSA